MIQIPEPPTVAACGRCNHTLRWLWSTTRNAWVAFVSTDDRLTIRYHDHLPQDRATWKDLSAVPDPDQLVRNAAGYARAVQALKTKSSNDEGDQQ